MKTWISIYKKINTYISIPCKKPYWQFLTFKYCKFPLRKPIRTKLYGLTIQDLRITSQETELKLDNYIKSYITIKFIYNSCNSINKVSCKGHQNQQTIFEFHSALGTDSTYNTVQVLRGKKQQTYLHQRISNFKSPTPYRPICDELLKARI